LSDKFVMESCNIHFKHCCYRGKKKAPGAAGKRGTMSTAQKKAEKAAISKKMAKMTKEEKENFKKGKRDSGSDSEYSYKSFVSDGGTRHVARRRRREDGTYSAAHSYHSSQVGWN